MNAMESLKTLKAQLAALELQDDYVHQNLRVFEAHCFHTRSRMVEMTLAEMAGTVSAEELNAAKLAYQKALDDLENVERMHGFCHDNIPDLEKSIERAQEDIFREFDAQAEFLEGIRKRLKGDKKLRAQLVELFGLAATISIFGADGVSGHEELPDAFPKPESVKADIQSDVPF